MAKKKPDTAPQHEESPAPIPAITMADVARILSTPDDVLLVWMRKGEEAARKMKAA